ncbi:MAG TPA: 50S ribosomal protein L10 [Bacteroidia bacterium]|jgi:large subunit ribosomal protein L10|nr:50S ribosomal protein L10 [Bacteroidia bacterium]HNO71322.1 50S ribosomal protein L10 [Bacteroidia bacterium]
MNKQEKNQMIDSLSTMLKENPHFYLTDTSGLTVEKTNKLRRLCFDKNIKMVVVKNTLLSKAMEKTSSNYEPLHDTLKGSTSIMFCSVANDPAKLIKDFRKEGNEKPVLKAAYVEESVYIGHNQLDALANIKSKNEMIGEVIALLQSPAKNVISGLLSGKNKIAGIVKTLESR